MHLHELRSPDGSRRRAKRTGRGTGSGHGKTAGRGTKGQHHRSEGFRLGFEGGQMPYAQRIPKLGGFKNPFKRTFTIVNLSRLSRFQDGASVGPEELIEAGLATAGAEIKVLGAGKLRRKLSLTVHAISESARTAIEARGGSVTLIGGEKPKKPDKIDAGTEPAPPAEPEAGAPEA